MAIKKQLPPPEVLAVVQRGTTAAKSLEAVRENQVTEDHHPHKVYTLSLADICAGRGYQAATQIGWRVFHHTDEEAAVEVYSDPSGSMHQFGGVNRGPFVEGTKAALAQAESLKELGDDDFLLNVLRLPALYTMALWLQHEDPNHDVIVPVAPVAHGLEANRPYSWPEFLGELRAEAEAKLEEEHPPGGDG